MMQSTGPVGAGNQPSYPAKNSMFTATDNDDNKNKYSGHLNPIANIGQTSISVPRSSIHELLNANVIEASTPQPISANSISSLSSQSPTQNLAAIDTTTSTIQIEKPEQSKPKLKSKKKSTNEEKVLVSTSSPEGIAAASEITPNRISKILLKEGPLPIRHLTGHLIEQIPVFGNLSLSKQRRLIMAALESGDLATGCIFEKIGWGQWEAKVVGADVVRMKIENSSNGISSNDATDMNHQFSEKMYLSNTNSNVSVNDNSSKLKKPRAQSHTIRRESITSHLTEGYRVPTSPTLGPIQNFRNNLRQYGDLDEAIKSSSEDDLVEDDDEDDDDDDDDENDDDEFDEEMNNSHAHKRTLKYSPSPETIDTTITGKIPSVSSSRRTSFAGISKPRKPRSSFNQHTIEVALDEAPLERRESRVSFSNSANLSRQSFLRTNIMPHLNNDIVSLYKDTENAIADDYEDFKLNRDHSSPDSAAVITDEEDWQSQGPSLIKNNRQSSILGSHNSSLQDFRLKNTSQTYSQGPKTMEELAAIALMDMKSV